MSDSTPTATDEQSGAVCPECGDLHQQLDMFPKRPITVDELFAIEESSDTIEYVGPTAVNMGVDRPDTCETIVIGIEDSVSVLSYYPDTGWITVFRDDDTFTGDEGPSDRTPALLINEMASQSVEAGYNCVEHWLANGEPGGNFPS